MGFDMTKVKGYAVFSECGAFRYTLTREWMPQKQQILYVMLNPSTADAAKNDPTVARCVVRAQLGGFGRVVVCNLFGWRETDPSLMVRRWQLGNDVVGPENDRYIADQARKSAVTVVAWGANELVGKRDAHVLKILYSCTSPVVCLGLTKDGYPKHPLHVAYTEDFQRYKGRHAQ